MTPPYVLTDYHNTWRFRNDDGLFEIHQEKGNAIFNLKFLRYIKETGKFIGPWELLLNQQGDKEKILFNEAVDNGIDKFLEDHNLSVKLSEKLMARFLIPTKNMTRMVSSKKYAIEPNISYMYGDNRAYAHCDCGETRVHPAKYHIKIFPYKDAHGSNTKSYKCISDISFNCEEFEKGPVYLQTILKDPKIIVMENFL